MHCILELQSSPCQLTAISASSVSCQTYVESVLAGQGSRELRKTSALMLVLCLSCQPDEICKLL